MRCVICESLSFSLICKECKKRIKPSFYKREIDENFFVYSFFPYNDIAPLLHTKHKPCGRYIYNFLSQITFAKFLKNYDENICLIPIDDKPKGGYSHTAVLVHAVKSKKSFYHSLRATNSVSYSGKSLSFRKKNPRNFTCKIKTDRDIVLIDDLITTGTTLLEAKKVLKKANLNPIFALTLADAKVK